MSPAIGLVPGRFALAADTPACAVPAPAQMTLGTSASPVASPVAASPIAATPSASPVAEAGQAADPATASAIEQAVKTIAACQSTADYNILAQLVTPTFLSHVYGGGLPLSASQFLELSKSLPAANVAIESVGDVRVSPSGAVSADVVWVSGKQVKHARWSFVDTPNNPGDSTGGEAAQAFGTWQADDLEPLPVNVAADAQTFAIKITDNGFSPTSIKADKGSDIVLDGTNAGKQDHELLVLRLGKGMKVADLLLATGPALPKGVEFIGQVTIPAKSTGELVLTEMPRATYVIVDMLPDADGVPFLSEGLAATLTVS